MRLTRLARVASCHVPDEFKSSVPVCFTDVEIDGHMAQSFSTDPFGPGLSNASLPTWHWSVGGDRRWREGLA